MTIVHVCDMPRLAIFYRRVRRREELKKKIKLTGDVDPRALMTAQMLGAWDLGKVGVGEEGKGRAS